MTVFTSATLHSVYHHFIYGSREILYTIRGRITEREKRKVAPGMFEMKWTPTTCK